MGGRGSNTGLVARGEMYPVDGDDGVETRDVEELPNVQSWNSTSELTDSSLLLLREFKAVGQDLSFPALFGRMVRPLWRKVRSLLDWVDSDLTLAIGSRKDTSTGGYVSLDSVFEDMLVRPAMFS